MSARVCLFSLVLTLVAECPVVFLAYARVAPPGRRIAAALAVNFTTHGLLWASWRVLPWAYRTRLGIAESVIVLAEAGCYRMFLGGTAPRALVVSMVANALSVAAGLWLPPALVDTW